MFNLGKSGIFAGAAFLLSFLIGLVSKTSMPLLIVRPLIFAVLFFILSGAVNFIITHFLPELTEDMPFNEDQGPIPGSRINITEEDSSLFPPDYTQGDAGAMPGKAFLGAQPDDSDEDIGNVADILQKKAIPPSAGMDQNMEDGYTKNTGVGEESRYQGKADVLSGDVSADASGMDMLPDLDSMAGAFLPSLSGEEQDTTEYSVSTPPPKPSSGRKNPDWTGDFNAKDMASGLRTILNKQKEG